MKLIADLRAGIVGYLVGMLMTFLIGNRKRIWLSMKTLFWYRNKEVRMSLAYLFLIDIDNKRLLIKGNRINQFQPIGGVFQYYNSFDSKIEEWKIQNAPNEQFYENRDLRIIVPAKNVVPIIDWFYSKKNREITVHREFIEELVNQGPLELQDLNSVEFEYLRTEQTNLEMKPYFNMLELNIYEIYRVNILDLEVLDKLRQVAVVNDKFYLVSTDDIKKENVVINEVSNKIGNHTKLVI